MIFTRYFLISPRLELIQSVAQADAEGAAALEDKEVWSIDFSYRAIPGVDVDAVLSTKVKLSFLLSLAYEYGLAESKEDAFRGELKRAIGWPRLSVESFDRNWELAFADTGVIRQEDCNQAAAAVLKSVTLQLPKELSIDERGWVAEWIEKLATSQIQ